jgi:hypothetical protein
MNVNPTYQRFLLSAVWTRSRFLLKFSMPRRRKFLFVLFAALIFLATAYIWFDLIPRSRFQLGMYASQIEGTKGIDMLDLIPFARALPNENARTHAPAYEAHLPRYAVTLRFNANKQLIQVRFLFGKPLQDPKYEE